MQGGEPPHVGEPDAAQVSGKCHWLAVPHLLCCRTSSCVVSFTTFVVGVHSGCALWTTDWLQFAHLLGSQLVTLHMAGAGSATQSDNIATVAAMLAPDVYATSWAYRPNEQPT